MKTYVRTNYVPERHVKHFTKGQWYEFDVSRAERGHTYGNIVADNGVAYFIRLKGSFHLDEKDWDVVRSNTHPDSLEPSESVIKFTKEEADNIYEILKSLPPVSNKLKEASKRFKDNLGFAYASDNQEKLFTQPSKPFDYIHGGCYTGVKTTPTNTPKISKEKALECLEDLDDFARMDIGVAPTGQYETLKKFIEQAE